VFQLRNLLWVDCAAGGAVGVFVLALSGWLSELYALPHAVVLAMGGANLLYAAYSFSLAVQRTRPMPLIVLLAVANGLWGVGCLVAAGVFAGTASPLGVAQFILEGLFVGGLGVIEWVNRKRLVTAG
jgi:uncharacterized membrane protein YcfT